MDDAITGLSLDDVKPGLSLDDAKPGLSLDAKHGLSVDDANRDSHWMQNLDSR